jgi:hypothetical protein
LRLLLKLAANDLQHVFEKGVEHCKKCITCQGRYFKKDTIPHLHRVPTWRNKMSPRTFQTALIECIVTVVIDPGPLSFCSDE